VSSMVNVDTWKIPVQCPKCGIKNEVTLEQIKKGATIQCVVCGQVNQVFAILSPEQSPPPFTNQNFPS
jgi:uncharacterized Zn finger protein